MSRKGEKNLIVALDIGTSKVVAIVGEITANNEIDIVGIGSNPSRGLKKRRGGEHRVNGAVHSACHRGGRADGWLSDPFGLCGYSREPYS